MSVNAIKNYVGGGWTAPASRDELPVTNPATAEVIAKVPLSSKSDIDRAASAAAEALPAWRRTPPGDRIQPLFKLKQLLEENLEDLARTITDECGKTREESVGELRRGIENVEVACGIPMMLQGQISEDIASGIDEIMIRQPVGVVGIVTPFNFPGMIPLWFLPYAIACGNTLVLKPSEKVPLTMHKIFQLLERTGLPKGVANLVNGSRETVEALVDHPEVRAISLVGSTPVARAVFARAAANGKRAQCQGGAKNPVIVLPDADMEAATRIVADSAFGCAGQRCLASSVAITVGDAGRGAEVPLRGPGREHRNQRRRRRPHRVLPVQRVEGQLLRRPPRPGARRGRLLHGEEGGRRALAEGVVSNILSGFHSSRDA